MESYLELLEHISIFAGISKQEIPDIINLLKGKIKNFNKKKMIWQAQEDVTSFGIILEGSIEAINPARPSEIIQCFKSGEIFGEAIAFGNHKSFVNIIASQDTKILFINSLSVLKNMNNSTVTQLTANLLKELSKKLSLMSFKNQLLSEPRIRTRFMMYLSSLPSNQEGYKILPFFQNKLAEYLNVNKSAFNRELQRMKREGLIIINGRLIKIVGEKNNG